MTAFAKTGNPFYPKCSIHVSETPEVGEQGGHVYPQVLGYHLTLFGTRWQIMPAILLLAPHLFEWCGVSVYHSMGSGDNLLGAIHKILHHLRRRVEMGGKDWWHRIVVNKMVLKFWGKMLTSFMKGPLCNINKGRREEEQKLVLLQSSSYKAQTFFSSFMNKTLFLWDITIKATVS